MQLYTSVMLVFSLFLVVYVQRTLENDEVGLLLEFKKGIRSDPSNRIYNSWNRDPENGSSCPKNWHGITCGSEGLVNAIVLVGLNLTGNLQFSPLSGLTMLRNLSLSGNNFTGHIVPAIGKMTTLEHLDLSRNSFYGHIPRRITDLWNLRYLNLSYNKLSGGFSIESSKLHQLEILDLQSNEIEGNISDVLSQFQMVEHVDLSCNKFYGGLDSPSFGNFANIVKYVNLSHNELGSEFFSDDIVQIFKYLEVLDVSYNNFKGKFPFFNASNNLQVLNARNNRFNGLIPENLIVDVVSLVELDLSVNNFSGPIMNFSSTSLRVLNLSSNMLSGALPSHLGSLNVLNLSVVDLRFNKFSGPLPVSLFSSMRLVDLRLSGNGFNGTIPLEGAHQAKSLLLPSYSSMEFLDISDNSLTGLLPPEIGFMKKLKYLDLRNNTLSGEIPNEISNLVKLEYLDLSFNSFEGDIPDDIPEKNLKLLNISYNHLSGSVPHGLRRFPHNSFFPGNNLLTLDDNASPKTNGVSISVDTKHEHSQSSIRVAIIFGSVAVVMMVIFLLLAYHRAALQEFYGRSGIAGLPDTDMQRRFIPPTIFRSRTGDPTPSTLSFSNDHLLSPNPRCDKKDYPSGTDVNLQGECHSTHPLDNYIPNTESRTANRSPLTSPNHFADACLAEQPVTLNVYSPDRLVGDLFFLDGSLFFTVEELSRSPAEVLGRSSHGTLYKATIDNGHILTVKWFRVGLVRNKKEFAKEVRKIGSLRHPNIVPLRGYYWGPREQERLILADYANGNSLALHLYATNVPESTPGRYSTLTLIQRLKIAIDIAQCLFFLHNDRGLPHGNLKPTNVVLSGPNLTAQLTDYGLHRLMTPAGAAEQILNLGALGYRAPELATASKPAPSFKADIYAFGVILMELLTRRSAGDIVSGQSGAVDLVDWVRLYAQEGRVSDCFDKDIIGMEDDSSRAVEELLEVSLKCTLSVNERPSIKTVLDALCSIRV